MKNNRISSQLMTPFILGKVLERGEKLEILIEKTEDLEASVR